MQHKQLSGDRTTTSAPDEEFAIIGWLMVQAGRG